MAKSRAYTVQEIDALRQCARNRYLWGSYGPPEFGEPGRSCSYREADLIRHVEETTRTFMLAGLRASDLLSPAPAKRRERT